MGIKTSNAPLVLPPANLGKSQTLANPLKETSIPMIRPWMKMDDTAAKKKACRIQKRSRTFNFTKNIADCTTPISS